MDFKVVYMRFTAVHLPLLVHTQARKAKRE